MIQQVKSKLKHRKFSRERQKAFQYKYDIFLIRRRMKLEHCLPRINNELSYQRSACAVLEQFYQTYGDHEILFERYLQIHKMLNDRANVLAFCVGIASGICGALLLSFIETKTPFILIIILSLLMGFFSERIIHIFDTDTDKKDIFLLEREAAILQRTLLID